MSELIAFMQSFGTPLGLLLFILYKEVPLRLKKKSGNWIDLKDLKEEISKRNFDFQKHVVDDLRIQAEIASELKSYKSEQAQINLNLQNGVTEIKLTVSKIFDKLDRLTELILKEAPK